MATETPLTRHSGYFSCLEKKSVWSGYLVVVEKDAVFQRLVEDGFPDLANCVLITARGMPDMASRAFAAALCAACSHLIPVARASTCFHP